MISMLFSIAVTLLFLSFFASVVLTGYFRNIARAKKLLIDIPDKSRKFHFRPTPLIGGLSIHASMLLSSLFMLFLIDYKYDFQFDGMSLSKKSQIQSSYEVGYSKKLSIKKENDDEAEDFRLNVVKQTDDLGNSETYDVKFSSRNSDFINITQIGQDIFDVTLPNGQTKSYKATNSGIIELNSSGEEISELFIIEDDSTEFFSFSSFTATFIIIAILLQLFILYDDAFGIKPSKRIILQSIASLTLIYFGEVYIENLQISLLGIDLELGYWGIPFTIFATVGIINAFNMIDGINGLCAGFALVALGALQIASGFDVANYSLVIAMGSIIGFLFYNLGFLGLKRRVFLGDNGEVFYKSPGTFVEYYKNPESTADTKDSEGWVATGDAGFFGEVGFLVRRFLVRHRHLEGKALKISLQSASEFLLPLLFICVLGDHSLQITVKKDVFLRRLTSSRPAHQGLHWRRPL